MFHCNGWCHTWAWTAAGGTHVCLARIDPVLIVQCIQNQAITHFARAPVVLYLLMRHSSIENFQQLRRITVATRAATPTSQLIVWYTIVHLYSPEIWNNKEVLDHLVFLILSLFSQGLLKNSILSNKNLCLRTITHRVCVLLVFLSPKHYTVPYW